MGFVKVTEEWMKLTDTAKLNYGEVILLCKIASLSNNKDKACTASNDYFAALLCTTDRNVQRYLKSLKKAEVIKTFEKKQGMKTTTRYIYPQYDKISTLITVYDQNHNIAHDEIDICSDEAHDNFGMTTRQIWSEDMTDLVKAHDNSVTLIREEKREKENKVADAPNVASLQAANAVKNKWIPKDDKSKEIFGSDIHSDVMVMSILSIECLDKTVEEICNDTWVTSCHINTDMIAEYCNDVLFA
jgi:hypothetical protein